MKKRALYSVLIFLIAAGAFVGLVSSYKRVVIESQNSSVELAIDYNDVQKLSLREGISSDELLAKLKGAGITSIALTEDTLDKLELDGSVAWITGYEFETLAKITKTKKKEKKNSPQVGRFINPSIKTLLRAAKGDTLSSYVIATDPASFHFVKNGLDIMIGKDRVKKVSSDMIKVSDDEEDLLSLGIGIPGRKIDMVISKGFYVIPRIKNNYRLDGERLSAKLQELSSYGPFTKVVFDGEEVGGYRNNISSVAAALKEYDVDYGYVEMAEQKGDSLLLKNMGTGIVRVHSIPEDEMQKKMTKAEALDRFERAVSERGVRVLFIRPFYTLQGPHKDLTTTNLSYINDIKSNVLKSGHTIGAAGRPVPLRVKTGALLLIALAVAAGFCLLLSAFWNISLKAVAVVLSTAVFATVFFRYVGQSMLFEKLCALAAAIIFPSLSISSVFDLGKKTDIIFSSISRPVAMVLASFFISMTGALIVIGALSDSLFMLGAQQFIGIKAAFVLPIAFVALYCAVKGSDNMKEKLLQWLNTPITGMVVMVFGVVAVAGALYILRSGNFGIGVLDSERLARALLENLMVVRPRTKEFLIGYPALLLGAVYYLKSDRKLLWAFLLIGVIGPISTLNTFCHVHSPLLISVLRALYGVILGTAAGLIYYLVYLACRKLSRS